MEFCLTQYPPSPQGPRRVSSRSDALTSLLTYSDFLHGEFGDSEGLDNDKMKTTRDQRKVRYGRYRAFLRRQERVMPFPFCDAFLSLYRLQDRRILHQYNEAMVIRSQRVHHQIHLFVLDLHPMRVLSHLSLRRDNRVRVLDMKSWRLNGRCASRTTSAGVL